MNFMSRFNPSSVGHLNRAMARMLSPSMAQAFAEMQRLQDQVFGLDPFEERSVGRRNPFRDRFSNRTTSRLPTNPQNQQTQGDQAQAQETTNQGEQQGSNAPATTNQQRNQQLARAYSRPGDLWGSFFDFPFEREITEFTPTLNVVENKDNYALNFSIPGGKKEEIKVSVDGEDEKVLTVSGERRHEFKDERKEDGFAHFEESFGAFSRSIALPQNVNIPNIKARFEDGVLKITLPKLEPVEPEKPKSQEVAIE